MVLDSNSNTLKMYARIYVNDLKPALAHVELMTGMKLDWHEGIPELGLELVGIADLLIIAGSNESLAPFRETQATFVVKDIDFTIREIESVGAEIINGPFDAPNGRGFNARHKNGAVIEYIQWTDDLIHRVLGS
ncbi:VOC family protein [Paenibacillus durus]|uniref:VOC domain-containing protein n=1 Tax=Paenibacillus durus ATCC 35681 TaxID=1333534 RepID=A0A0F7F758_PAEDU|nr:glyoxalase/bleomycin resistance/dioxygenase family protein [Paenibacillus durus]AKG33874.1 hypothetical protein VK70_04115 [Paenibacillus durus ATCC 35681]